MDKNPVLKVQIAKDGTISVSVNTALDTMYREMFSIACRNAATDTDHIEHSVRAIIFGCFWLEAYTNNLVREILSQETKRQKLADVLWDNVKKANFHEKLKIVLVIAGDEVSGQFNTINSRLKTAFDLRNRLAHFKDDDQFVAKNMHPHDFENILENLPDADLVKQLIHPKLEDYIRAIQDGGQWLDGVAAKYFKETE